MSSETEGLTVILMVKKIFIQKAELGLHVQRSDKIWLVTQQDWDDNISEEIFFHIRNCQCNQDGCLNEQNSVTLDQKMVHSQANRKFCLRY